ncbi:MAG: DUF692 domain-containing protein [Rickettsiales bacterium]|nr:DUF692 domain-containing protein [Pseudomonadota bacterium]MDA0966719.1 DUF692 domain-containing protein [Pseudomonadota bacterium]MDG4544471.1 DUF692 domain-containing protein [Rickettsiales bacterium]MDG4546623.1 DUF692 domain-containing protein [Rickettsiales bacterium]MDG4548770.1 DUF692 domain-containing protein [Rickettsiales bacterium]
MQKELKNLSIPKNVGIGLRGKHYKEVLENAPKVNWFEVHSENFFAQGGMAIHILERVREKYPVSFHGVGLSLGSADGLSDEHLKKLKNIVDRFKPCLVSEHISWSNIGSTTLNDLLPLPYTDESLSVLVDNINHTQDYLGRKILVENPSSYLEYNDSTMTEWEFIQKTIEKSGCGLLLDVNNIYVTCKNHNLDANEYLQNIPYDAVGEIHLAGFEEKQIKDKPILIDTHGDKVSDDVWKLYEQTIGLSGIVPTLIEWDTNIPEFDILLNEAKKAQDILNRYEEKNAVA